MNIKNNKRLVMAIVRAAGLVLCLAAGGVQAANVYWDGGSVAIAGNGNSVSAGGTGTWDTVIQNWDAGASPHVAWTNDTNDTAIFAGTVGLVTLSAPITVGGLTFNTANYILSSNTLTFGASGNIANSVNATINSVIAGDATITKTGAGKLSLGGGNTYTGGAILTGGSVATILANSFGSGTITFASGTTTLEPNYNSFPVVTNSVQVNSGATNAISSVTQYFGITFSGPVSGSGALTVSMANVANTMPNAGFTSAANTFDGALIATGLGTVRVRSFADSANPVRLGGARPLNWDPAPRLR